MRITFAICTVYCLGSGDTQALRIQPMYKVCACADDI